MFQYFEISCLGSSCHSKLRNSRRETDLGHRWFTLVHVYFEVDFVVFMISGNTCELDLWRDSKAQGKFRAATVRKKKRGVRS